MAMAFAIPPGVFILLLSIQNIFAQQCLNNNVFQQSASSQQALPKTTFSFVPTAQNSGLNFNVPQQANLQQMNFQQPSNIQQTPVTQQTGNLQPQSNLQQANAQQPVNSITNSQNQNIAPNIYSALNNIRLSSQCQGTNHAKVNPTQQTNSCGYKQNVEQIYQNQPTFASSPGSNIPQTVNQPASVTTSFAESPTIQPTLTFQSFSNIPPQNNPLQQNHQVFGQNLNSFDGQNQGIPSYFVQNQPIPISATSPLVSNGQINTAQSQPIIFTLQTPQSTLQSPQTSSSAKSAQSQPLIYTVQTEPLTAPMQNQQSFPNQVLGPNNNPMDNQSILSLVMSQMQSPQGNLNGLASILPALLNTKSEKSSGIKTLLPLLLSLLNERRSGCGCPHCGCANDNQQNTQEPTIYSGYSNQKIYNQVAPINPISVKSTETDNAILTAKVQDRKTIKNNIINKESDELSDEYEGDEYEDEDIDDE